MEDCLFFRAVCSLFSMLIIDLGVLLDLLWLMAVTSEVSQAVSLNCFYPELMLTYVRP